MARLIEVQDVSLIATAIFLQSGDLLLFKATGGRVVPDAGVIEIIGPFTEGFLEPGGSILSAAGTPDTILFLARGPGEVQIEVVTGDPFYKISTVKLTVTVSL